MKFNLNVKTIQFTAAVFIISSVFSCNRVTDAMRPFLLSDDQEIQLGRNLNNQILSDTKNYPRYNGSTSVKNFVDSLGQRIASVQKDWNYSSLKFTFTIINDTTQINAFSIPGGYVYVYTGLLKAASNSSELAGVLAHEIGHITKHHGADKLIQGQAVGYVNTILFGNDSSSIASAVASLAENLVFLGFSKGDEYQADSCAVAYTVKADINPVGMEHFLGYLQKKYGDTPKIFEPLSDHPPLSDRMKKVREIIGKIGADTTKSPDAEQYLKIRGSI